MWPYIGRNVARGPADPDRQIGASLLLQKSGIKLKTDVFFFPRKKEEMRLLFRRDAQHTKRRSSLGNSSPLYEILFPQITETHVSNPYVRMSQPFLGKDFVRTRLCIFLYFTRRPAYLSSQLTELKEPELRNFWYLIAEKKMREK